MNTNSSILIVGASGFIGGHLIEGCLQKNYTTIAGIRDNTNRSHLTNKQIYITEFDYEDANILKKQLSKLKQENGIPKYIIYNAGITKAVNFSDFEKINYLNLKRFIDTLIQTECIPDKFLYLSSLSVMGKGDELNYTPFKVSDTPNPDSEYGKSKLKAEEYIKGTNNLPYIILRPTGVYGPNEKDYFLMMKSIKKGVNFQVGYKPQNLSFIYVKDLIDAIFLALESKKRNRTYFVSDDKKYTDQEFTQILKELLNINHTINIRCPIWLLKLVCSISDLASGIAGKASTINKDKFHILKQRNWSCDITPIKTELSFSPKYNLKEGLEECLKWYKNNNWI